MEAVLPMNGFMELTEGDLMIIDGGNLHDALNDYVAGMGSIVGGVTTIGASLAQRNTSKKIAGVATGASLVIGGAGLVIYSAIDLFK